MMLILIPMQLAEVHIQNPIFKKVSAINLDLQFVSNRVRNVWNLVLSANKKH